MTENLHEIEGKKPASMSEWMHGWMPQTLIRNSSQIQCWCLANGSVPRYYAYLGVSLNIYGIITQYLNLGMFTIVIKIK